MSFSAAFEASLDAVFPVSLLPIFEMISKNPEPR